MYGGGANVWPGAAATGGAGGAGHRLLAMNGAGPGTNGAGFCGRPTSAVAHVPTHRSPTPLCAKAPGSTRRHTIASASAYTTATPTPRGVCKSRSVVNLIVLLLGRRFYSREA